MGWPDALGAGIDDDWGHAGSRAPQRPGLQRLVADVALGQGGIVMGRAIARLARHPAACQPWLQMGGLNPTLLGEAEAMDALTPRHERLMLGLQGTRAEAERCPMRPRLQGGLRPKAARGELAPKRPLGFVYAPAGTGTRDPEQHVPAAIQWLCNPCWQGGSSRGVGRYGNQPGRTFPTPPSKGPHGGEGWWTALSSALAWRLRPHPRDAGACAEGRTRVSQRPRGGASSQKRTREAWPA